LLPLDSIGQTCILRKEYSNPKANNAILCYPRICRKSLTYLVYVNSGHHTNTLGFPTRTVNAFMELASRAMTSDHSCRWSSPDFVIEYTRRAGPAFSVSQVDVKWPFTSSVRNMCLPETTRSPMRCR
jgi:hypothetical protein